MTCAKALVPLIFSEISACLRPGCIVTDVGSTKVLPHRWAAKTLPSTVYYVGSHPVAGSEQRGVEFARPDLFEHSCCVLTTTKTTHRPAVKTLKYFWSKLGCSICSMTPPEHDRIFANISHLPHILATSLVNATDARELKFAGKGFVDTTRIASSPPNIWTDILLSNATNTSRNINRLVAKLLKLKKAIDSHDRDEISKFLESARGKRAVLLKLQDS
jgi:prephenate dehydrogenase